MVFKFVLFLFVIFLLIRFVMRFLLPIMKMTRMTHKHMNDMRQRMDGMQQQNNSAKQRRVDGDYIDYEEVK